MQLLENVTLAAIAIVDDPAVPKAYFRVVKRNLDTPESDEVIKIDDSTMTGRQDSSLDLTKVYTMLDTIVQKLDNFISQTSAAITDMQSHLAELQAPPGEQPITESIGSEWVDTLTYLQASYQDGEIDDVAYDTLLGELELGLSQQIEV